MKYVIVIFFIIISFAIYKEYIEVDDAYKNGIPSQNNSIPTLLKKIVICAGYEQNLIIWRKVAIITVIEVIVLHLVVYDRFPSPKESLLSFIVLFSLTYAVFMYQNKLATVPVSYVKENIKRVKKRMQEKEGSLADMLNLL